MKGELNDKGAGRQVVVFDGDCHFCSWGAEFVLKHDRTGELKFARVQSALGGQLLEQHGISSIDPNSFLFVVNSGAFTKSDAAIELAAYLGPWRIFKLIRIIPRRLRDLAYDLIAKNRYKLFGKRKACFIPTPEQRRRFIDD